MDENSDDTMSSVCSGRERANPTSTQATGASAPGAAVLASRGAEAELAALHRSPG